MSSTRTLSANTVTLSATTTTASITGPVVSIAHGTGSNDRIYHRQGLSPSSNIAWTEHNDIGVANIVVFDIGPEEEVSELEIRWAGFPRLNVGSSNVTVNTSSGSMAGSQTGYRRMINGDRTVYREVCFMSQSVGAVSVNAAAFVLSDNCVTKIIAEVIVSNDTDNEGGSFATLTKTFRRFGGVPVTIGSTVTIGSSSLDTSISTATCALTSSGNNAVVIGTGVSGKTISWSTTVTAFERTIT